MKLRELSEVQRNALLYSTSAALGLLLLFQPLLTAGPPTFWTVVTWILFLLLTWGVFYSLFKKREEESLHEINYEDWFLHGFIIFIFAFFASVAAFLSNSHINYGYGIIGAFLLALAIGRLTAYD